MNEISSGNSGAKGQDPVGLTLRQSDDQEQVRVEEVKDTILVDFHEIMISEAAKLDDAIKL